MLKIGSLLRPENVAVGVKAASKKQVFLEAAKMLAASSGLTEAEIFRALLDRENLGSTGFGRGAAVPHARIHDLGNTYMVFMRLAQPVDFDANDGQPVDLRDRGQLRRDGGAAEGSGRSLSQFAKFGYLGKTAASEERGRSLRRPD